MCLYLLEVNTDEQRESALRFSGMHAASNLVGMTQPSVSFIQSYSYARTMHAHTRACAHTHTDKDTVHAHTGFA